MWGFNMADNRDECRKIWAEISGATRLLEIYGYWPTFHDATVEQINIRRETAEVVMIFHYIDLRSGGESEAATEIHILWKDVQRYELLLEGYVVYGVAFSYDDDFILTEFEEYRWGLGGKIRSKAVEITNVTILDCVE